MSAKPEAKETPAAAPDAAKEATAAKSGGLLPVILAVVLAPVLSWAVIEFVLFPRLLKKAGQTTAASAEHAAEAPAAEEKHEAKGHGEGKEGKESGAPANAYVFTNVVVNLSGTMGTRYLKTSFIVTGKDAAIKGTFEADKARLTDVTLGVLSSLTLADLEEPGSKNILRERLVGAYNQTIGRKVAEQVFFSEFVVQ